GPGIPMPMAPMPAISTATSSRSIALSRSKPRHDPLARLVTEPADHLPTHVGAPIKKPIRRKLRPFAVNSRWRHAICAGSQGAADGEKHVNLVAYSMARCSWYIGNFLCPGRACRRDKSNFARLRDCTGKAQSGGQGLGIGWSWQLYCEYDWLQRLPHPSELGDFRQSFPGRDRANQYG